MQAPSASYPVEPGIWAGSHIGTASHEQTVSLIGWLQMQGIQCIIDVSSPDDHLPAYQMLLAQHAPVIV